MKQLRTQKLIQTGLQLRLVFSFMGVALIGVLLQFLLIHREMLAAASKIQGAGGELAEAVPGVTLRALAITLLVLVPLLFFIGIWRTFRIAGPVYRFEQFLRAVVEGEQSAPCKLRKGDELKGLCDLINQATEPARRQAEEQSPELERLAG